MAKKSPAKIKKMAAEAKRAASANKEEKKLASVQSASNSDADLERYESLGQAWRAMGLSAPAQRGLVDEGLYELADLRKVSLDAVKDIHGIGENAVRILVRELKRADLSFRK